MQTDESLAKLEPELLVRQILVNKFENAEIISKNISDGQSFKEIAKNDPSNKYKKNESLMEWKKANEMPKLFSDALKDKDVGFITEPIKSGAGYHILKLEDKKGNLVRYEDQWLARHILLIPSAIRSEEQARIELNNIRDMRQIHKLEIYKCGEDCDEASLKVSHITFARRNKEVFYLLKKRG